MKIIGLTGNISSGKTNILNYIKKLNIPTHDSDVVVTRLYRNSSNEFIKYLNLLKIKNATKYKKINKNIIREAVLKNNTKLKKLEKFIHNKVQTSRNKFLEKNRKLKKSIVVVDIPLLFEKKLEHICNYIFLAYCPPHIRKARALKAKKTNKEDFKKFLKLQIPDRKKINKVDFVIDTSKSKSHSNIQALKAIKKIQNQVKNERTSS